MSSRGGRTKPTTGRSNSAGSDEETSKSSPSMLAPAAVPAPATVVAPLDPTAGRKASTELVAQQQLALLASQFLTTARNFTDVDIDISQDADMLAMAKSRFDSGLALIGLLEPHVASSRECKAKYGDLEVACFKIASKCGAQPWAQRYVSNYRSGAPATAQSNAMDVTSPIMTLASAAAASAMPMNTSTASARPLTAPTAFPMLNNPYPVLSPHMANHPHLTASSMTNSALAAMGINGLPQPVPVSERYVVLGRNQKPREKKPEEVSIPGKGRKKINPSDMRGKSSNVLSSAMYSIQTHAKNGGKITILLSEAYRRRNEERRNKRKRKFGEVDAAVNKLHRTSTHPGDEEDDDSEDDEARAAFFAQNATGGQANAQGNRLPLASAQELQQLEAEMMQAFDTTLTNIRRFREARGDFQVPDEKSNYFAAFSAPDGRFYGEQGNVQKGEYELMMQLFEALHGKPIEQHCRFSAAKTKYNTFKCPYESLGVVEDEYGMTQATQGGVDDEEDEIYHHHQQMLAEGNGNVSNNNQTFNI